MPPQKKSNRYLLWMTIRQITSTKGHGLSFMTTVSILGVAIGVAALVTVLSVMGGLEGDLKGKLLKGLPHIEILADNAILGFSLKEHPISAIEKRFPDATGIEPFTRSDVVIKRRKHLASATLFGIDPDLGGKLWGFSKGITSGGKDGFSELKNEDPNGVPKIFLGESLSISLSAQVGDKVVIFSPQLSSQDVLSGQSPTSTFEVAGIFDTDMPGDARYGVVSLASGRKFLPDYDASLDEEEYVTGVALDFTRPELVDAYPDLGADFTGMKALSWKAVNMSLLFALKLEKYTMGAILLLIVLVASFSISGTMMMTVYHKRSQVALLRALGMNRAEVAKLFVAQGMAIGTIGVFFGLVFGLGLCVLFGYLKLDLPPDVYYQKTIPIKFLPFEYCVISICAWVLTLCAAVYPAITAARQDPGVGLRYL